MVLARASAYVLAEELRAEGVRREEGVGGVSTYREGQRHARWVGAE